MLLIVVKFSQSVLLIKLHSSDGHHVSGFICTHANMQFMDVMLSAKPFMKCTERLSSGTDINCIPLFTFCYHSHSAIDANLSLSVRNVCIRSNAYMVEPTPFPHCQQSFFMCLCANAMANPCIYFTAHIQYFCPRLVATSSNNLQVSRTLVCASMPCTLVSAYTNQVR